MSHFFSLLQSDSFIPLPDCFYRLRDILGEDWETIIAAHPDCKVFGDHPLLPPPDVHDPLQLMGYAFFFYFSFFFQ